MNRYQEFALLCEMVMLSEESSLSKLLHTPKGLPDAARFLLKTLHKTYGLKHDASYRAVPKISWTDVKANNSWILFRCAKGYAALKTTNNGNYSILASANTARSADDIKISNETHGGRIMEWIEANVGSVRTIYISNSGTSDETSLKRMKAKTSAAPGGMTIAGIAKKFKPVLTKILLQTTDDVKGMAIQRLKSGNYDAIKRQIEVLKKLESMMDYLDRGLDPGGDFTNVVKGAVYLACAHFYPDRTQITGRSGVDITLSNDSMVRPFIADIGQGDAKKLSAVLSYFKQLLVHVS